MSLSTLFKALNFIAVEYTPFIAYMSFHLMSFLSLNYLHMNLMLGSIYKPHLTQTLSLHNYCQKKCIHKCTDHCIIQISLNPLQMRKWPFCHMKPFSTFLMIVAQLLIRGERERSPQLSQIMLPSSPPVMPEVPRSYYLG